MIFNSSAKAKVPLCLFFLMICLIFSCDKEELNKEFGKYSIAVNYKGTELLELHFVMDGEELGRFIPVSGVNPSYVTDCKTLTHPDELINVVVFNEIAKGKHTLEINTSDGRLVKVLEFEMLNSECVFQDTDISFD